jgi:copper(I)-binding protein
MWRIVDMAPKTFFAALLLLISAGCVGIFGQPDIKVSYPKAVYSPMVEDAISLFMFIENRGDGDDYLISARINECPNSRVELHDIVNGKMTMIEKLKVPAGGIVELKGGSYHVMVFDVTEPVSEITIVLNFEKSGEVVVKTEMPQKKSTEMQGSMEGMM